MAFEKFLAYSASAGSGKTYALSIRYLSLLFLGEKANNILAATFTKKAANEMNQRIIKFLELLDKDENLLDSLSEASGLSKEEILSKQNEVKSLFLREKNYIVTLDSFFNTILRSFALQIALEPNFEIKDSVHDNLETNFIKELDKSSKIDSLVNLVTTLEKKRAPDVISLFEKIFNLEPILPKENYSLQHLEPLKKDILAKKEAFVNKLNSIDAPPRVQNLLNEDNILKIITKGLFGYETLSEHSWFKKTYKKDPSIDNYFFELKDAIKKYLNALEETILYYLFNLYNTYKEVRLSECRAKNTLSFNDVLYYTYSLVSNKLSKDFIYFRLDSKFKHILLDEFQDTSSLQYLILKPLIEEIFSGVGTSDFRSFFYVGDTKQSLYRFRGGVEGLFEYVAKSFSMKIEHLDTNYRSAKNIVSFTNKVFTNSEITDFKPQKAKSKIDGYVEVLKTNELLEKAKERVEFYLDAKANINDIAILVFTNKDGIALQEYLKERGINSILKTSSSLKHNPKIAALVNLLEYLIKKEDIFLAPFLAKIKKEQIDLSFLDGLISPFEILDKIIATFGYFDNDENILKLLDFAKDFLTIEEFLDEFKKSNIPLAKKSSHGVQIMTIHGSKGLEFKYVIVLDRIGKKVPDRELLLFEEKTPIEIKKIYTKYKNKESFVLEYFKALEKHKELLKKDDLNVLYVAVTRAELALSLVLKDKDSEFDILDIHEEKLGELFIEQSRDNIEFKTLSNKIHSYGKQELEHDLKEEDKINNIKEFQKIYFGEALHYALELISFTNPNFNTLKNTLLNKYGEILESSEIEEIIKRVKNLLNNREFLSLIKDKKIFKEQPLTYQNNLYQLDLLLEDEEKMVVIDYKSSKKLHNMHKKQVSNYIEALKAINNKSTCGYLLYILENSIELIAIN